MPEFRPRFAADADDCFTRGYLAAAEWLAHTDLGEQAEEEDRDNATGWAEEALTEAVADCRAFQASYGAEIALYQMLSRRGAESAGHDFYLSRNGHGAGFFDRGDHPTFGYLLEQAAAFGYADCVLCDDGFYRFL